MRRWKTSWRENEMATKFCIFCYAEVTVGGLIVTDGDDTLYVCERCKPRFIVLEEDDDNEDES
jgi:hypothetical protein